MKIEIAEHGRMTESGSSLLRLIQNQSMPLLDLLVREAVQNSLDATNGNSPFVGVDISVGSFRSKELNKHFDEIHRALNNRFTDAQLYKYISVRDSETQGLTGPVRYDDVQNNNFGNLLKLVYEICKPQQNEGAGGSWGLGKTIYFRLGIGLVIYYSRIFQNGKYRSRLAACLVEDETKNDSIIPSRGRVKRGIAWWGESDGKNKTVPLENEREIERILSVFGITPYSGDETGTTVIIPYINTEDLLHEVYAKNDDLEHKPYWTNSVEEYLKVALQRWYAPRYLNTNYPYGAYLKPKVNGKKLKVNSMLPLFRTIRELYIFATYGEPDESFIKEMGAEAVCESINIREVFVPGTSSAGTLAYLKMTDAQLLMTAPDNNKGPYQQITNSIVPMEEGRNTPVIMFTRRPGMIVGYDFDGSWTHRMPRSGENEFIIGLFVANSGNCMKNITDPRTGNALTLEEYIRQGEKADHASWSDRNISGNNPRVISKVQNGVIKKISAKYKEKDISVTEKKNIGLGHALANILLPAVDFGRRSASPPIPGPGPGGSRSGKKSYVTITGKPRFVSGKVVADYEMILKKNAVLNLQIVTDFKKLDAEDWEKDKGVGKRFPLEFISLSVNKIKKLGARRFKDVQDISLSVKNQKYKSDSLGIEFQKSARYGVYSSVLFSVSESFVVCGTAVFESDDPSVKGVFELKENK